MYKNPLGRLILARCFLLGLLLFNNGYCWNALGHRLIAQIAYNHLTPSAKLRYNHYNQSVGRGYRPLSFVNAAPWLDSLHDPNKPWLQERHYINLPFSPDGSKLLPAKKINAVSAITEAQMAIQSKTTSDLEKGYNLRVLTHVVGDIHQPLHAVSQFSRSYPKGDKGGNLVYLAKNPIATNLHSYWDKGGGFLNKSKRFSNKQLVKKALTIEKNWPGGSVKRKLDPQEWALESQQLAINSAYKIKSGQKPDIAYQMMVKKITQQRIALAGCRLAAILNQLA